MFWFVFRRGVWSTLPDILFGRRSRRRQKRFPETPRDFSQTQIFFGNVCGNIHFPSLSWSIFPTYWKAEVEEDCDEERISGKPR